MSLSKKISEISFSGAATGVNTGLLGLLFYQNYNINTKLDQQDKHNSTLLRNLNILNMEFKKWIYGETETNLKVKEEIEEIRQIILEQSQEILLLREKVRRLEIQKDKNNEYTMNSKLKNIDSVQNKNTSEKDIVRGDMTEKMY